MKNLITVLCFAVLSFGCTESASKRLARQEREREENAVLRKKAAFSRYAGAVPFEPEDSFLYSDKLTIQLQDQFEREKGTTRWIERYDFDVERAGREIFLSMREGDGDIRLSCSEDDASGLVAAHRVHRFGRRYLMFFKVEGVSRMRFELKAEYGRDTEPTIGLEDTQRRLYRGSFIDVVVLNEGEPATF